MTLMDAAEPFCYLTTTGRRSGQPHMIEIWFAAVDRSLYLISGGRDRSDWVRNLLARPSASVRVSEEQLEVQVRLPLDDGPERDEAVTRLHDKYGGQVTSTADDWRRWAYIVALDIR